MPAYVIAEAGSCHDGSLQKAQQLIKEAKDTGADAVKFQFYSDPERLADRRCVPATYREVYRKYQIPSDWLPALHERAGVCGIDFMCTAYLPEDVIAIAPHVRHFKIASFENDALDLLEAHRPHLRDDESSKRFVLISLGLHGTSPLARYRSSSQWYDFVGRLKLLHCVSAYPAPAWALGLSRIRRGLDGFSDHSDPDLTWTGALAVASGAEFVEAHLRLYETHPQNPDAPHAMTPQQFADYVQHIRFAETCLTTMPDAVERAEAAMAQYKVKA